MIEKRTMQVKIKIQSRTETKMKNQKITKDPTPTIDFNLKDQNRIDFNLSNYRGQYVLLSFHPLAWTSVCARQMQMLDENFERFEKLNVLPVGMSVDSVPSKEQWAKELGLKKLRLLADFWPHGEVAKQLGIFRERHGFSERANIIIDPAGQVIFEKVYEISQLPDLEEIFNFLENIEKES